MGYRIRHKRLLTLLLALSLLAFACSGADTPGDTAAGDDAGSDDAGSDDAGSDDGGSDDGGSDDGGSDDAGSGDDEPGPLAELAFIDAGVGLQYLLPHLALEQGYFEEEGLDVTFAGAASGGADATAALTGGDVQIMQATFGNVASTRAQGLDLIAIAPSLEINAVSLVVAEEVLEETGVTLDDPLEDRMAALAEYGAVIGISSPGSGSDAYIRFLCHEGGIDCDGDITLQPLGGLGENVAAFQQRQIHGIVRGHPDMDIVAEESDGVVFVPALDVPSMAGFVHTAMITTESLMAERRDDIVAFLRGIGKAAKYAEANPDEMRDFAKDLTAPDLDDDLFDSGWGLLRDGIPTDPVIDPEGIDVVVGVLEVVGQVPEIDPEDAYDNELAQEAWDDIADWTP